MVMVTGVIDQAHSPSRVALCQHCRQEIPKSRNDKYCCPGCLMAHQLIKNLSLEKFYQLNKNNSLAIDRKRTIPSFEIYDQEEFQAGFCEKIDEETKRAHLQIGSLQCYACIWVCQ